MSDRNPVRSMKKLGLGWNADEALALSGGNTVSFQVLVDRVRPSAEMVAGAKV